MEQITAGDSDHPLDESALREIFGGEDEDPK